MKVEILDNTKKKKIIQVLDENYGIHSLPYLLVKTGSDKIRAYSGNLSVEELNDLAKIVHVELLGAKLCTLTNDGARLNFDFLNMPQIKSQITKNTLEIQESEISKWFKGGNLDIKPESEDKFIIIKHKEDLLGIAHNRNHFLHNYLPKETRLKN